MTNDICEYCGGTHKVRRFKGGQLLCNKHYLQMSRYGKIKDRTNRDSNEIVIKINHAELIVYNREGEEKARALISLEDIERVRQIKWYKHSKRGYINCVNTKTISSLLGKKTMALHRFIMDCPEDMVVDHINHNVLDNRRENLRICSQKENCQNRQIKRKEVM